MIPIPLSQFPPTDYKPFDIPEKTLEQELLELGFVADERLFEILLEICDKKYIDLDEQKRFKKRLKKKLKRK